MNRMIRILSLNINNFGGNVVKPVPPVPPTKPEEPPKTDDDYEEKMAKYNCKLEDYKRKYADYKRKYKEWKCDENVRARMKRAEEIAIWLIEQKVDIVSLQEFDNATCAGLSFENRVQEKFNIFKPPHDEFFGEKGSITILLVSKDIEVQVNNAPNGLTTQRRWIDIHIHIDKYKLNLLGVHIPYGKNDRSANFWEKLISYSKSAKNCIIIGDMNVYTEKDSESAEKSENADRQRELETKFCDSFLLKHPKIKEFTHYVRGKGRRLDYAYISTELKNSIVESQHLHNVNLSTNEAGFTDHSAVLVELKFCLN